MAGLGSRQSLLKGDAKNGEVTLKFDDETFTRTLQREGNLSKLCQPDLTNIGTIVG